MLSDDFAAKHDLCGYGMEQFQTQVNRDVKEIWHDDNLKIGGTILMWIASRASYEKKELIRCCAELMKEVVNCTGAQTAAAEACIQNSLDWCDGKVDRSQVDVALKDCLIRAKQANGKVEKTAWSALSQLGRCIRSTSSCASLASSVTATLAAAGEDAQAVQQRLAKTVRRCISWDDLDSTIRANKTSPDPRKKTPDEVAADTQRMMAQFEQLLKGIEDAQALKDQAFTSAGTSAEKMRGFLQSNRMSARTQSLVNDKAAELDAADGQPEIAKASAAPPRRPRMTV
ncbi:MAG TPA: hypothetical protein VM510_14275 [Caulifigura sp.]|nr:hypothetical protein [Caulifigura sp.]